MPDIENSDTKKEFRRKLEVFEPKSINAATYDLSQDDFGVALLIRSDCQISLGPIFATDNNGVIRILNASNGENLKLALNFAVFDIDLGETLSNPYSFDVSLETASGFDLYYEDDTGFCIKRITSNYFSSFIPDNGEGTVGETLTDDPLVGVPILVTNTAYSLASIPLTPGTWEIHGWASIGQVAGSCTNRRFGIASAAGTVAAVGQPFVFENTDPLVLQSRTLGDFAGPILAEVLVNTTYHIYAAVTFTAGTFSATGSMYAKRIK